MKLTVVRPLLIDVYIKGRNRNPPVLAWAAPQKSRSSAGPILLMQLWREIVRRATGKDGPCGTHLWPLATVGQTMLSWRCAAILIIDEPYKRGGRPFAAKQESREPRAAAVFNTMSGFVTGRREGAHELSRQVRTSGRRHPADPPRRRRQGHGPRQFRRRYDNAGHAVGPHQAQPACSCPDRIDQYRKGAGVARRQGGHHPRRFSRHHARARAYRRRAA